MLRIDAVALFRARAATRDRTISMPTAVTPVYRMFARSDLLLAVCGALVMAVAGAGMASALGTGTGGAAHVESHTSVPIAAAD